MRWLSAHKVLATGIAVPLVLLLLYNTPFVSRYTQRVIGEKIVQLALEVSDQIQSITYNEVRYSLISSQLSFHNLEVSFHPHQNDSVSNYISAHAIHLDIDGLWKIYFSKALDIEGFSIDTPGVRIHKQLVEGEKTTLSLQAGDLYASISTILRALAIQTFELKNGHFIFYLHEKDGTSAITINDLSLWVENFELNNNSQNRTDKILFTDNLKVKLVNQSVGLPDSLHTITFDSLLLSTADDSFYIHGFQLASKKEESVIANYYNLHIPLLDITNVNYSKAYNERELEIDKIKLTGGDVSIDNQKTTVKNKNPDLLLQLNQVFGKLSIKELALVDTKLSVNVYPIGTPEKFTLDQLDLSIYEINLDQSNTSLDFDHRYFKELELTLKNHSFEMANRNHRLEIERLHISTKTKLFSADKIAISPIQYDPKISTLNEAEIENLTVEGFDPYAFVNDRQLLLKGIQVQKLTVKTTPKAHSNTAGINPILSLEDLFPFIQPYADRLKIDSLSIQDINLDIATNNGPFLVKKATLIIDSFTLDSTTHLQPENIFEVKNFIVFAPKSILPVKNQQIEIDSFYINKDLALVSTKTIQFSKKEGSGGLGVNGKLDELYFKGLKLRQILYQQRFLFDSLTIKHPVLEVHESGVFSREKNQPSTISNFISEFEIGMISVEDGEIKYLEGDLEIASIDSLGILVVNAALSSEDLKHNEVFVKYEDFLITFNNLYYSTPEFKHILEVQSCQFHLKDSTGTIQNIHLTPIVDKDSLSLYTLSIPEINFKGINDYNSYFNKKIDISRLHILNPSIGINVGISNSDKESRKGIPAIESKMLLFGWDSLGIQDFQLSNGQLRFDKADQKLRVDTFQLDVSDFNVTAGEVMTPERFLYSEEVKLGLSSIHYSSNSDSISIQQATLSSKNKNLYVGDSRFSLHQTRPIDGYLPSVELSGFSFYDFTQFKKIKADEVTIKNPEIGISLSEKTTAPAADKFAQLNSYPFNPDQIAAVDISRSSITNAKILGINDSIFSIGSIGFNLTNFILHPDSITRNNLPFHSEKFELIVADLNYRINPFTKIRIGVLDYNSKPSNITIDSFALVPLYDKITFGEKMGEQASWLALSNSKIKINALNFEELIGNRNIEAKSIVIDDVNLDVYRDKRLPFPINQVRELPQKTLLEIPLKVTIDSLLLKSGNIEYVEQSSKIDATGRIFFDGMRASIANITNDSLAILKNPNMKVKIETSLYGAAPVVASFDFNLADPEYGYTYSISVGAFNLVKLNEILEPATLAKVKQGNLNSLQQVVTANDDYAQGKMIFRYDNLKVGLIKSIDEPSPGLGKALASFFANTFIVRSRNPAPFIRKSDVFYERNHSKSIFDFLVKSTLSGVVESIGARSNRKKIKQHKKDAKQQARKKNKVLPTDTE